MKIDSHHHLWSYTRAEFAWVDDLPVLQRDFGAEEFGGLLKGAGYDGSIVVQARQSVDETRFLLDTARSWPYIRGVVGWVDLASSDLSDQLDRLAGGALVGVRHVAQAEPPGYLLRPEVLRGLREIERRGLVYELLLLPGQLSDAVELVRRFPAMSFVLDHLGKPMEGELDVWRKNVRPLAEHPGVSVKAAGWFSESWPSRWAEPTVRSLLDTAFDLFGPHRILAASNWPVSELAGPYPWAMHWLEDYVGQFPDEIRSQILGDNARRVYSLGGH